jgi:mono/diheme cytochrome c family protein
MHRSSRRISWSALSLAAVALIAVSCAEKKAETTSGDPATAGGATPMTQLQRGEMLSYVAGCQDCHTPGGMYGAPHFERQLSGSELGWGGPWGVTYSRNLTPDVETGLGSWTDEEILRALRSGVRKDGSPLMPPMPWQNIARLPQEDLAAIVAYLRSIPPVKHVPPARVPPGVKPPSGTLVFPPPPAWDAPKAPAS